MPLRKQPKEKSTLRDFLKKEVAKDKEKIKHPDAPRHANSLNKQGRYPLTQSNLSALSNFPRSVAKVNSAVESPTTAHYVLGSSSVRYHGFDSPGSASMGSPVQPSAMRYGDVNSLFGGDDDADSIFGEPLMTLPTRDQELQAQVERFLADGTPKIPIPIFTESGNLRELKEDLYKLVLLETDGNMMDREWNLLQRQKSPLIEEVRWMEESERSAFEESRARKNQGQELPEPIGHIEKRQLGWNKKRLEKARSGTERSNKRPRQDEDCDNDNDLDGEERLRLGKLLKPKPLQMTGHFWSTRHDYFPGLPGAQVVTTDSGAEILLEKTLRDFDPDERKAKRRELAVLGEALAKADRNSKRYLR